MDAFYALADQHRRKIVEILAGRGRLTATQICNYFKLTPQAISQHLKVLLESKVLRMEKDAQRRIYQINPDSMMDLEEWARNTRQAWNNRFDALDNVLEEEKKKNANR